MTAPATAAPLPELQRQALARAVAQLEQPGFVSRLAQVAGSPADLLIKVLPKSVNARLRDLVKTAIFRCLDMAVRTLDLDDPDEAWDTPSPWVGKLMTGVTGGVGGFIGPLALPFELPLTTTLMLRDIAEIARDEGEDLKDPEALLACLEVFALGGGREEEGAELNLEYFAVRAALSELTREAARTLMERGAINASTPVIARLIGEIVSRFGFAVGDRFASGVFPVIGAIGGASVNMIFMDHFQRVARSHFTVRRLERAFGAERVRAAYRREADALNLIKPQRPPARAA